MSIVWFLIRGRKHFNGPPVPKDADPSLEGEAIHDRPEAGIAEVIGHTAGYKPE